MVVEVGDREMRFKIRSSGNFAALDGHPNSRQAGTIPWRAKNHPQSSHRSPTIKFPNPLSPPKSPAIFRQKINSHPPTPSKAPASTSRPREPISQTNRRTAGRRHSLQKKKNARPPIPRPPPPPLRREQRHQPQHTRQIPRQNLQKVPRKSHRQSPRRLRPRCRAGPRLDTGRAHARARGRRQQRRRRRCPPAKKATARG